MKTVALLAAIAALGAGADASRCAPKNGTTTTTTTGPPYTVPANSTSVYTPTAPPTSPATSPAATGPCALASSAWAAQTAASPLGTFLRSKELEGRLRLGEADDEAVPTIPAVLAHECLQSVPLHTAEAIALVDAIEPYLEWQSDAAYKADPPAGYFYPAYDLFAALAQVRANLVAGGVYASEYAFQRALYLDVFGRGHDGHFVFYPDLLTRVFDYGRAVSLVSVVPEGAAGDVAALPEIKLLDDVVASPETAPAVVLINGVDAATYVADTIFAASFNQDDDAAYNSMFFAKAVYGAAEGAGYFAGGGRIRYLYQGPNTTLAFANGSAVTYENIAHVRGSLAGITDGESLFARFCSGALTASAAAATSTSSSSSSSSSATPAPSAVSGVTVPGYPAPVDITDDAIVSCYYLEGAGFEDVAVLSLLAFESESPAEFQAVTRSCLAQARAAGKTRLVVDLSANGGGYILQGYDLFRQLFPATVQDGFSRWKANAGFVALAEIDSAAVAGVDPYTTPDAALVIDYETWFDYRYDLNLTNQPFPSFASKFGPYVYQDTNYTALMRWNLDDPLTTRNATFGMGIDITGYGALAAANGSAAAAATPPFAAADIVLVYDGFCASTCTLASEMLRIQAGVRSVAFGGRPRPGPIQGVGGIKGAQTLAFSDVYAYAQAGLQQATTDAQRAELRRYSDLPIRRSSAAALNTRDQILRGNVVDGLPAQYVREDADCRLFWTAAMATDVTAVWKAAARAAFLGAPCAAGDLSRASTAVPRSPAPAPAPRSVDQARASREAREAVVRRQRVAAEKHAQLARRGVAESADEKRLHAMFNQKVVV